MRMTHRFDEEEARVVSANTGLISGRQSLDQLAERIGVEHKAAYGAAREALEHARMAGQLLTEAKQLVPHGQWLPWLKENFEFTARTAQGYMRLVEHWSELEGKCETVAHLGLREALALLAQPKELEPHEYCAIFPRMQDWEYEGLKRSLKSNGFYEYFPITLFEGKILDGKERYRACLEVGVDPKFVNYEDGVHRGGPLDFVIARNITRQHLSEDQRAMVIARIEAHVGNKLGDKTNEITFRDT
jgi:hypothetical protein